ncbi:hypothetical protein D3C71_1299020 [compost metagenome]
MVWKKSPAPAVLNISGRFQLVMSSGGFFGPLATNFGNHGQVESYSILQLKSFAKSVSRYLCTSSPHGPPHSPMRSTAPPASKTEPS